MTAIGGHRHRLTTALGVNECVRRLRDEVGEPHNPSLKLRGWLPFKDKPTIWRKIHGQHFLLLTELADPRERWYFYGHMLSQNGTTTITGRYRTPTGLAVIFAILCLYSVYLLIGSFSGKPVLILSRHGGWQTTSPIFALAFGFGLVVIVLGVYLLHGVTMRKKRYLEEQEILTFLTQILDAKDDVPSG